MELKKGINLGGFLSQCVHTKEHYDTFIVKDDIERIKSYGFDHVRLPIDSEVIEYSNGNVIEEGYKKIEEVIGWTREEGLDIISQTVLKEDTGERKRVKDTDIGKGLQEQIDDLKVLYEIYKNGII